MKNLVPCFFCFTFSWALFPVSAVQAQSDFVKARSALTKVHVIGKLRVFYDTQGDNAVDPADQNANGTPDQVEDIATQTYAAWLLLVQGLGFPDPFTGERFKGTPFLDINLLSNSVLTGGKGTANGITYDEIQHFNRPGDPAGTGTLCFDVSTSVKAPLSMTPAHELFHVIQNGVTYFKSRWYSEGTARWSEAALGRGGAGGAKGGLRGTWPVSESALKVIFESSYEASLQFWEPLTIALDPIGKIPSDKIPASLKDMHYVNGDQVMKDLDLHGWQIIRDVLIELGKADDAAFKERGLQRWGEVDQKSPDNSPFIYKAVTDVIEKLK